MGEWLGPPIVFTMVAVFLAVLAWLICARLFRDWASPLVSALVATIVCIIGFTITGSVISVLTHILKYKSLFEIAAQNSEGAFSYFLGTGSELVGLAVFSCLVCGTVRFLRVLGGQNSEILEIPNSNIGQQISGKTAGTDIKTPRSWRAFWPQVANWPIGACSHFILSAFLGAIAGQFLTLLLASLAGERAFFHVLNNPLTLSSTQIWLGVLAGLSIAGLRFFGLRKNMK